MLINILIYWSFAYSSNKHLLKHKLLMKCYIYDVLTLLTKHI